jgi:hypothetical protein
MMGYLATQPAFDEPRLRKALAYGTVVASFNVEDFSLARLQEITREDIDRRFRQYQAMLAI